MLHCSGRGRCSTASYGSRQPKQDGPGNADQVDPDRITYPVPLLRLPALKPLRSDDLEYEEPDGEGSEEREIAKELCGLPGCTRLGEIDGEVVGADRTQHSHHHLRDHERHVRNPVQPWRVDGAPQQASISECRVHRHDMLDKLEVGAGCGDIVENDERTHRRGSGNQQ